MDVLVRLEDPPGDSTVMAHVNSVPGHPHGARVRREVVTLYGAADPQALALALAATVEGARFGREARDAVRHFGIWANRGAVGDAAWRDTATGDLVTHDLDIPLADLEARATALWGSCGPTLRRVAAGLAMADWPEGADRAVTFTLHAGSTPAYGSVVLPDADGEAEWLQRLREGDATAGEVDAETEGD
ncbi:MAG: hypothetical protein KJT01_08895 [Gemmatimonadetes bacterium]|nr:hypothetical protein [Gemmatimonadota bacterium]